LFVAIFIYGFVGEVGAIVLSVTYTPLYIGLNRVGSVSNFTRVDLKVFISVGLTSALLIYTINLRNKKQFRDRTNRV
jgi:hypothetical protein